MIYEFLTNYRKELLDKCSLINNEIEALKLNRRETEKFSGLIASENEQPFSDFSPHVVNSRAQEKLKELAHEMDDIDLRLDKMESEIASANETVAKIDLALEEFQVLKEGSDASVDSSFGGNKRNDVNDEAFTLNQKIKVTLEQIISYLPADPMRAKVELENIISGL